MNPVSDYPSPIIEMNLPGPWDRHTLLIPRNERMRYDNIFVKREYDIPSNLLPSTPLTVVDVGANNGLFALFMKTIRADSTIICFEPVPQTLELLHKNINGHEAIQVYPYALSDHSGTADISLHPTNTGENSLKSDMGATGRSVAVQLMDAATAFKQLGLTYVDVLKIDTEGCEVEILESLQNHLPYVGIVMAEYHCENDRRKIDRLLSGHTMWGARIETIHLGVVKYINNRLLQQ
jgi:FkbM family methyltransferase